MMNIVAGSLVKKSNLISNRWIIPIIFGLSVFIEACYALYGNGFSFPPDLKQAFADLLWNATVDTSISVTMHQTYKTLIKNSVTDSSVKNKPMDPTPNGTE